jgi:taurine dioxygenase
VHVHPVSGERALLLGHFVKRISGLAAGESARIFEILQNRVTRLENTVRWQWRTNDVAIWDNRATQHYAINDYGTQPRIVRRVTIAGEPSVSVDGRHGRTLRAPYAAESAAA